MDRSARVLAAYEADLASHEAIQGLVTRLHADDRGITAEVHEQLRRMLGRPEQ